MCLNHGTTCRVAASRLHPIGGMKRPREGKRAWDSRPAARGRAPPSQARSGDTLKTYRRHVSLTGFRLIGSSPAAHGRREDRVRHLTRFVRYLKW